MTPDSAELALLKRLEWTEIFAIWRSYEEQLPHWIALYQERGFTSWEEWRATYLKPLRLPERIWGLYRVINPARSVPNFICPPVRSLVPTLYAGNRAPTFRELVEKRPESATHGSTPKILESGLLTDTTVIGVLTDSGLVVVDGLHRCSAIAITAMRGLPVSLNLTIALADYEPGELPLFGGERKK